MRIECIFTFSSTSPSCNAVTIIIVGRRLMRNNDTQRPYIFMLLFYYNIIVFVDRYLGVYIYLMLYTYPTCPLEKYVIRFRWTFSKRSGNTFKTCPTHENVRIHKPRVRCVYYSSNNNYAVKEPPPWQPVVGHRGHSTTRHTRVPLLYLYILLDFPPRILCSAGGGTWKKKKKYTGQSPDVVL